jgi:ATP synthase protein I
MNDRPQDDRPERDPGRSEPANAGKRDPGRSGPANAGKRGQSLADQVGAKAARKLAAQRDASPGLWFGLGMMGVIGWSVAIPTVLGAALGVWLDNRHPSHHSWTLALLVAGLVLGCANAWHWVAKEDKAMRSGDRDE